MVVPRILLVVLPALSILMLVMGVAAGSLLWLVLGAVGLTNFVLFERHRLRHRIAARHRT